MPLDLLLVLVLLQFLQLLPFLPLLLSPFPFHLYLQLDLPQALFIEQLSAVGLLVDLAEEQLALFQVAGCEFLVLDPGFFMALLAGFQPALVVYLLQVQVKAELGHGLVEGLGHLLFPFFLLQFLHCARDFRLLLALLVGRLEAEQSLGFALGAFTDSSIHGF